MAHNYGDKTNLANQNSIQVLQNHTIKKIYFKKRNEPVIGDLKKNWNPKIS